MQQITNTIVNFELNDDEEKFKTTCFLFMNSRIVMNALRYLLDAYKYSTLDGSGNF